MKSLSKIYLLICILLLVLFPRSLKSQEWIRVLGEGIDVGVRYIIEDYDKGYLVVADATSYEYTYLIKIDINGYKLWDKYFGNGSYFNVPCNIEITPDSGYIIAGTMGKYGSYDAYILKLNSCYEKEWCKVLYNPDQMDYGRKVRPLPGGGFILITAYYAGIEAGERLHLHKFNENGDLLWQVPFISSDTLSINEEGKDLHVVNQNEYLISGYCFHPNPGQTNPVIMRPLVVKFDSSGNQIWDLTYGIDSNFYGKAISTAHDTLGNSYNVGFHKKVTGGETITLVKVSDDGDELYDADLLEGSFYSAQANTINWSSDTTFILASHWKEGFETPHHNGFLLIDTLGNLIKQKEVFTTSNTIVSTARTFDNKFVSVALHYDGNWDIYAYKLNDSLEYDTIYTATLEYDYRCPYPVVADTADLDCDFLVYQEEPVMPKMSEEIIIYPNPASTTITVDVSPFSGRCKDNQLEIMDIWGRSWIRKSIPGGEEEFSINVTHFPAGMYIAIVRCGTQIISKNKFITNNTP